MRCRSFMKRSSFIWGGNSSRAIRGPRTSSMRDVAALLLSTSSTSPRSSPAWRASRSASAAAALWSATKRFATSLRTIAWPAAPMKTARGRMVSSTGRQRAKTLRSPPTKMIPSPCATMALVPLIGQSRNARPLAVTSRARRSVSAGEMVLIWMIVAPAGPDAARPRGPSTTASTDASDGRTTHTASADFATASALGAARPPSSTSDFPFSATRSYPTTSWPPARRRPATAEPSSPSPTIPSVAIPAALPNARSLAVLARRVVAGVGGVLQELVGPVGPELTHAREGVDDRILKPAADALDLADVDVLDRVAEVVELHGAARGVGEVHAPERGAELLPVLDVAARRLERRPEHHARHVRPFRIVGGHLLVLGLVGPRELLVGGAREHRRVVERRHDAQDLVAHRAQHVLVGEGAAADERELLPQPRLLELLREPQRVGAGEDGVDRVHVAAEPRDVGGEIGGAERRPKLLEHLAARLLEGPLEARRHLPAEGEVVPDHRDLPVPEVVVYPLAEGVGRLRARPARADDPGTPLALRDVVRGHDRVERRDLLLVDVGRDRVADRRAHRPDQDVDPLPLDEAARLGEARRGLALVVFDDQLHLAPRELPALFLEKELEAVDHVLAVGGENSRLGRDEPDLERAPLRLTRAAEREGHDRQNERDEHERLLHGASHQDSAWRIASLPSGQPSAAATSRRENRCMSSPSIESTASAATITRKSRLVASKAAQRTQVEVLIPERTSVSAPSFRLSTNSRSVARNAL